MERALVSIHQEKLIEPIQLVYASTGGRVGLFVEYADQLEECVIGPIAANYPNCSIEPSERETASPTDGKTWCAELTLQPEILSILCHTQFEDLLYRTFADPVSGILRAIRPDLTSQCRIEISITPASQRRRRNAQLAVRILNREFFKVHHRLAKYFAQRITRRGRWIIAWILGAIARISPHRHRTTLDTTTSRLPVREELMHAAANKISGHLFEAHIRLVVHATNEKSASDRLRQIMGAFGAFTHSRMATFHVGRMRRGDSSRLTGQGMLLSHEELATLFHPPTTSVEAERMLSKEFSELEPPSRFCSGSERGAVVIGRALFRADDRLVGIDQDSRRRHMYIVGATGTGKSTLLLNLIHKDMNAGRGLSVIDVHGDLADAALQLVPKHRTNDVIVFDATSDQVIPFNPLECGDAKHVDQVTSGVVSAFKKLYDSWGPRLENLLRYAVFTSVEQHGSLLDMLKLLTDKAFRDHAILRVSDDVVRSFWINEFGTWNSQYRTEAVSSVTNKLMPFLTSRQLRAITANSARSSLNIRQAMDEQKILIVNLSRGKLGQDNSTLLGSLLLTSIEQSALTRADIPEAQRKDHFLFLDEFQSLTTPSTAIMLSEARKYRLSLILSHQLTRQLDPATFDAVIGNCGTLLSFRVGLQDAELLGPAMSKHPGQLASSDLCNLPNFTAYCRLLVHGHPSRPFSIRTLPAPMADSPERSAIVRAVSRRQHAME